MDLVLVLVDHVAAGLGVLRLDESLTCGVNAAADMVARLDEGHGGPPGGEIACRAEAGESAARDQHGNSVEISRHGHSWSASSCSNFSGKARELRRNFAAGDTTTARKKSAEIETTRRCPGCTRQAPTA